MFSHPLVFTLIRFAVVGGTVMLAFMGLNAVLAPRLGEQVAFLVAYVPAVALHFCLNKWWTFGCRRTDAGRQVSEYLVMVGITFLVQWSVFTALVTFTPVISWVAAGVANLAQMVLSFLIMQRRVFRATQDAALTRLNDGSEGTR